MGNAVETNGHIRCLSTDDENLEHVGMDSGIAAAEDAGRSAGANNCKNSVKHTNSSGRKRTVVSAEDNGFG